MFESKDIYNYARSLEKYTKDGKDVNFVISPLLRFSGDEVSVEGMFFSNENRNIYTMPENDRVKATSYYDVDTGERNAAFNNIAFRDEDLAGVPREWIDRNNRDAVYLLKRAFSGCFSKDESRYSETEDFVKFLIGSEYFKNQFVDLFSYTFKMYVNEKKAYMEGNGLEYADHMDILILPKVKTAFEAFEDYTKYAVTYAKLVQSGAMAVNPLNEIVGEFENFGKMLKEDYELYRNIFKDKEVVTFFKNHKVSSVVDSFNLASDTIEKISANNGGFDSIQRELMNLKTEFNNNHDIRDVQTKLLDVSKKIETLDRFVHLVDETNGYAKTMETLVRTNSVYTLNAGGMTTEQCVGRTIPKLLEWKKSNSIPIRYNNGTTYDPRNDLKNAISRVKGGFESEKYREYLSASVPNDLTDFYPRFEDTVKKVIDMEPYDNDLMNRGLAGFKRSYCEAVGAYSGKYKEIIPALIYVMKNAEKDLRAHRKCDLSFDEPALKMMSDYLKQGGEDKTERSVIVNSILDAMEKNYVSGGNAGSVYERPDEDIMSDIRSSMGLSGSNAGESGKAAGYVDSGMLRAAKEVLGNIIKNTDTELVNNNNIRALLGFLINLADSKALREETAFWEEKMSLESKKVTSIFSNSQKIAEKLNKKYGYALGQRVYSFDDITTQEGINRIRAAERAYAEITR